jgi:uncharacterized OB-fold protein
MQEMTLRMEYRTEDKCKFCGTKLGRPPATVCSYCGKNQEDKEEQDSRKGIKSPSCKG